MGILIILLSSVSWAFFGVAVKSWLPATPSSVISSLVFSLVIPMFFISMLLSGSPGILQADIPASAWVLLVVSGIIGIGIGYSLYYKSVMVLGITFTSSMGLLIPVIAAIISFFVFGERLQAVQIAGTAVLLSGCFFIIRVRVKTLPEHVDEGLSSRIL
jgi:drug/metabolite transporter (DMT)-like permease